MSIIYLHVIFNIKGSPDRRTEWFPQATSKHWTILHSGIRKHIQLSDIEIVEVVVQPLRFSACDWKLVNLIPRTTRAPLQHPWAQPFILNCLEMCGFYLTCMSLRIKASKMRKYKETVMVLLLLEMKWKIIWGGECFTQVSTQHSTYDWNEWTTIYFTKFYTKKMYKLSLRMHLSPVAVKTNLNEFWCHL